MKHAPVYFVIAQARYNAILALEQYVPQIQEQFRLLGYPDFESGSVQVMNMGPGGPGLGAPFHFVQAPRFTFQNMDRTAGFILEQAALSFQTTRYEDFNNFSEEFLKGLGVVDKSAGLSFTDRIGYRYLDAVVPQGGKSLSHYVSEPVTGLFGRVEGSVSHAFTESVFNGNGVAVTVRTIIHTGPIGFPPDLAGMPLVIPDRLANLSLEHAILDTDGSWNTRDAFSIPLVKSRLEAIHVELKKAFNAIVTPQAVDEWR